MTVGARIGIVVDQSRSVHCVVPIKVVAGLAACKSLLGEIDEKSFLSLAVSMFACIAWAADMPSLAPSAARSSK